MPSSLMTSIAALLLLLMPLPVGAVSGPADPPEPAAQTEAVTWLGQISSADPATAARAEAALARLGPVATPAIGAWLSGDGREAAGVPRVLRVIGRVKDPAAMRLLLLEWEHESSRDALIDTWEAFGDACVSPLAGYLADAGPSTQERIVAALARVGQPAVPALLSLKATFSDDQSSVAERLVTLIDEAVLTAPVVSLARKGRVAWHDLETIAADPGADPRVAAQAVRGLRAISEGDEAPEALLRLSRMALTPQLHALVDPAADDARLILTSRRGPAAISGFGAILRDPAARDNLRMGAANALYGLGRDSLAELDKSAAAIPAGELSAYVRGLADSLRGLPAATGGSAPRAGGAQPAAASPCLGGADFTELARLEVGGLPVSARWFRRSPDGSRVLFTTSEKGLYRLVEMKSDGTGRRTIAPLAHQFSPSWSSDGREMAFLGSKAPIGSPAEYVDVYVGALAALSDISVDSKTGSGELVNITQSRGAYASPVWLPGRREVLYAANTFASPQTGGAAQTSAFLFRHDVVTGRATPLISLNGRIIIALEPSPDGRHVAFLSWRVDAPGSGAIQLHLIEADGSSPLEMAVAPAESIPGRGPDAREALVRGADLTWTRDSSRLTTSGRVVDVASWQVIALAAPPSPGGLGAASDIPGTLLAASRTFITDADGGVCIWFDDTRQIMRRCPGDRAAQPQADCRGALVWFDAPERRFGLFDALYGVFGVARLSGAGGPGARPFQAP